MSDNKKYLAIVLALSLPTALVSQADVYPGDTIYGDLVQQIYHDVSSDSISLTYNSAITNRTELCTTLTNRHNSGTNPGQTATNAAFIGQTISLSECLNALWFSQGYSSSAGWQSWAGYHNGSWFGSNNTFVDNAHWKAPVNQLAADPGDTDANGNRRVYSLQSVEFLGADRVGAARFGWNQSHHEVAYVWGWDPKDNSNQNGTVGAHVGWSFSSGGANCIVWVTKNEAFLECVKEFSAEKRRTSTGFFGYGQWTISQTSGRVAPSPIKLRPIDELREL